MSRYGILNKSYHLGRITKKSLKYRLKRRTDEVIRSIKEYHSGIPKNIIDLGTADGLMLNTLKNSFPFAKCIGIEYSRELVETHTNSKSIVLQGNVDFLPISSNSFDVVVATAIIEHLPNPKRMLDEAKRVLRPDGLIILTTPDPFWEHMATMVGHLPKELHFTALNIKKLVLLFNKVGFEILLQKKFMLSPVGMPLETTIENIVRGIGLDILFANQLVIAKKIEN